MRIHKKSSLIRILRFKSIKLWFTIPYLLILLVTIGSTGFYLIHANTVNSHIILKELQQQMLQQVKDQLTQRLQAAVQLNRINYDSLQHGILDLEDVIERERYFVNHLNSYPDVAMSFIGLPDGSFYGARRTQDGTVQVVRNDSSTGGASWYYETAASGEGTRLVEQFPDFDPRSRPWYIKALEAGSPTFSSVYSHFVFHEPTVTASHPVYNGKHELVGVLGVDYLLSWLGDTLGNLPIGAAGQVFITDEEGMLIATSSDIVSYTTVDNVSHLIPAAECENELIKASLNMPEHEYQYDLTGFTVEGKQYYVGLSHFKEFGNNWNIYVISAEDDFLGGVKLATLQTVLILLAALVLSFFSASWIAEKITRPIVNLSRAVKNFTRGELIPVPDDGRKDEIGVLNRSFNEMGLQLTKVLAHLEDEVEARTQELKKRNEELRQLSFSDSLTGIANRRLFDNIFANAWNHAYRHKAPIAVFMLDVDYFKDYNDTYGHQSGDDCLKAIGRILDQKFTRATDLVGRYGGDEFIVLLMYTDTNRLWAYADGIKNDIAALDLEHSSSPYGKVTVSIGIANMIPTGSSNSAELIELADKALYLAKMNGRSQVAGSE